MFLTSLRRELSNRARQSVIIAVGMALAIALVILVNGVSAGVKTAESTALQSVNGVGTDITITQAATAGSGGQQFRFGSGGTAGGSGASGSTSTGSNGSTNLSQSRLTVAMGTAAYSGSDLAKAKAVDGVSAATATLSLQSTSFSGSIQQGQSSSSGTSGSSGISGGAPSSSSGTAQRGPSSFDIDSFTVTGVSTGSTTVGPMTTTELASGRYLKTSDDGKDVVVVDSGYAKSNSLTVGSTLKIGGDSFTVVGVVRSTSSSSTTASDAYIPLDTAQKLSGETGKITDIYVTASSAGDVATLQRSLEKALPKATVNTEAELAASVSGSLSTVSTLVTGLGTWLSLLVLAAAFLIAVLFTISGVSRRTREFGTLKALGWRNGRVVRQVTGEALVNGLIGGAIGAIVGIVAIVVVNAISPKLSSSATASSTSGLPGGGFGGSGAPGGGAHSPAAATTEIALKIPFTIDIVLLAVGLSVLGGLIAGAFGGWRATRLRPAEALRSVA